jgi:hypothetical protein
MADNEDIKAKMREALDRKKPHDPGVTHADHHKGQGAPSQGPKGGDKQFRRKAGES